MDEDLKELDAMFEEMGGNEEAERNANSFGTVPDGSYNAEIISAEWTKSKDDVPMIKIEFGLEEIPNHVWDYLMFGDKNGDAEKASQALSRSVTKLRQLGLDATTISGYVSQLDQLEGRGLTLKLSTSKSGFQNKSYVDVKI
jgi:hypothetical protein